MPYKEMDDGHRIGLEDNVLAHAKQVFEQGLQLEAILLAHEFLEQKLNNAYGLAYRRQYMHRKFKPLIDLLKSERQIQESDYETLNEFNRLRNTNSHQILDFTLTLKGAKKGDVAKAMDLAAECDQVIARLTQKFSVSRGQRQGQK